MKRIIAVFLAYILLFLMFGCSKANKKISNDEIKIEIDNMEVQFLETNGSNKASDDYVKNFRQLSSDQIITVDTTTSNVNIDFGKKIPYKLHVNKYYLGGNPEFHSTKMKSEEDISVHDGKSEFSWLIPDMPWMNSSDGDVYTGVKLTLSFDNYVKEYYFVVKYYLMVAGTLP